LALYIQAIRKRTRICKNGEREVLMPTGFLLPDRRGHKVKDRILKEEM
jgi:hypothetical protein